MSKRDYIQEILAKKERFFFEGYPSSTGLFELEMDFQRIRDAKIPVETYLSVCLVGIAACLEKTVRNAIKTFIDSGVPYIERVNGFKDFFKFDLDVTKALYDRQITFGEFVSHFLPVKNVENINSHFGVLLNGSFSKILSEVREYREPSDDELTQGSEYRLNNPDTETPPLIIDNVKSIMANLEKLFTFRHIIAHEANFELVSLEDIETFFSSAQLFTDALEEVVRQTLNPDVPRSAFGNSLYNAEKAGELYQQAEDLYKKLHDFISDFSGEYFKPDIQELENTQEAFNNYLETEVSFENSLYRPVTGNALRNVEAHIYTLICSQRIERLKDALETAELLKR